MQVGDLVRHVHSRLGVGIVVAVREKAGIGKAYHVQWSSGASNAHRRSLLRPLEVACRLEIWSLGTIRSRCWASS